MIVAERIINFRPTQYPFCSASYSIYSLHDSSFNKFDKELFGIPMFRWSAMKEGACSALAMKSMISNARDTERTIIFVPSSFIAFPLFLITSLFLYPYYNYIVTSALRNVNL